MMRAMGLAGQKTRSRVLMPWLAAVAFCVVALLVGLAPMPSVAQDSAAKVTGAESSLPLWPAVRVLRDADGRKTIDDVLRTPDAFIAPSGAYATLGTASGVTWLRIPLSVASDATGEWVFDIDYPPLQKLDIYSVRGGQVAQRWLLGNVRAFAERPLRSRSHAVPLTLQAGDQQVLYVRAESDGALVLPVRLSRPAAFHAASLYEQMVQGVLIGVALMLFAYSLIQWLLLREREYLFYAILVLGSAVFSMLQFGTGTQFLWTDMFWFQRHAAGITSLVATLGSFLFFYQVLADAASPRWFRRAMPAGAWLCALLLAVYCLDAFDNRTLTAIIGVLGLAPAALALPIAVRRASRRDEVGIALVLAWLVYTLGTFTITGVISGRIDANFWSLHSFQIGATLDMLMFMYVLGHRTRSIRQAAQRATYEKEILRSLAYTDALTGLANRRGLTDALSEAIGTAKPGALVGLFVLDLDQFKPVNDRYGHDVGDDLLRIGAQRLRATVRDTDIVARTGGDEFVVVAANLRDDAEADRIANSLVIALSKPVQLPTVTDVTLTVNVTVGYALAPMQATDPHALMLIADRAMYEGKQGGRNRAVKAVKLT
ncbi:MAG: GGDEF domain-containing protein [Betaproteobacteria bacterium]|nr:MAG: GGDEF domain-containing protein [Betaproteobacteria bacterium]